jgi:hypothetical protein
MIMKLKKSEARAQGGCRASGKKIQRKENRITNLAESSEEGYATKGCFANDDDEMHEVPLLGQMKPVTTYVCFEQALEPLVSVEDNQILDLLSYY